MLASAAGTILLAGILGFLLIGSGVLLWEGIAVGVVAPRHATPAELRRARVMLAVGAIAFSVTLWITLGMLSRAW